MAKKVLYTKNFLSDRKEYRIVDFKINNDEFYIFTNCILSAAYNLPIK